MKNIFSTIIALFLLGSFQLTAQDAIPAQAQIQEIELSADLLQNIYVKSGPEMAKIHWTLDYSSFEQLKDKKVFIKYNTEINTKRIKAAKKANKPVPVGSDYKYSEPLDASSLNYTISGLNGNEKYVCYVGISNDKDPKNAEYSNKSKFKTERAWGIIKLLIMIGSLAFFIFGMKVMSEGLQRAAGDKMRRMLASITSNRFKGVLTGFGITSVVQSSSVTTVMTVSFVNAGLMSLRQSAGVMMGANIGTTVTAWLVLLLGFKVSISSYAFIILAFAGPLLFFKNNKARSWANALIGFCILFIGLSALKDSVPDLDKDSALVQFFVNYKDVWFGPVMFVILGAIVTIVIQSSSAAMALTLAMVDKGLIPFEVACAMVLGENIGTTITAEIASMIANVHAKRSARIHSMFNIVGVTWMLLIFTFALKGLGYIVGWWEGEPFDPNNNEMAETGIALFHTMFNLTNVLLLIWFVPQLVNLAIRSVRSRGDADEEFHLEYIKTGMMTTPELSILEVKKEVSKFGKIVRKQTGFVNELLIETDKKKYNKLQTKIKKYEEITDDMEVEISNYLAKVAEGKLSPASTQDVHGILGVVTDLERIGDINYQMSIGINRKNENKIFFTPQQRENLLEMYKVVEKAIAEMESNLNSDYRAVSITKAKEYETAINQMRNKLRKEHILSTEKAEYNIQSGLIYSDLFSSLEKVGDHVINVSEAISTEN